MYYSGDPALFHLEGAVTAFDILRGMFVEFVLTAFLVIVYISTAEDFHNRVYTKSMWPLVVGLATVAGMLGGSNSGGAMNPASGVAAAIAYWDVRNLAAYLLATFAVLLSGFSYILNSLEMTSMMRHCGRSVYSKVCDRKPKSLAGKTSSCISWWILCMTVCHQILSRLDLVGGFATRRCKTLFRRSKES